jgi:hypothetical protein
LEAGTADPLTVKVGVRPWTAFPELSIKVIVIVEVLEPFAETGLVPVIVDKVASAGAEVNVTVGPDLDTGVTRESVLTSATVEEKLHE